MISILLCWKWQLFNINVIFYVAAGSIYSFAVYFIADHEMSICHISKTTDPIFTRFVQIYGLLYVYENMVT